MNTLRKKVYELIHAPAPISRPARVVMIAIFSLIVLNVMAVVMETTPWGELHLRSHLHPFDAFSVIVFTIEYFLRLWSIVEDPEFHRPLKGRLRYLFTPLALIDLMAILPFYLPMLIPMDLRFLRIIRLFRVVRIIKTARYLEDLKLMIAVFKDKKEEIFITLFMGLILCLIASSLMYYVERDVQPVAFSSIPHAMWWGIGALTSVNYGDIYPVTTAGRILASIMAVLGVGMFALPAGILGSGFIEELRKRRVRSFKCPHCGKEIRREED